MSRVLLTSVYYTFCPNKKFIYSLYKYVRTVKPPKYVYCVCSNFRYYADDKKDRSLTETKRTSEVSTKFEQVKETTKTVSYWGIVIAGLGVTGALFYAIFRELFSSKSPNRVYGAALDRCRNEPRIIYTLGEPIKGFGEETRRGRRRHVSHLYYERDGKNYLRMKFYIQGANRKGTVHLEMKENDKGKYEYRYLFVQIPGNYPEEIIILEDNRYDDTYVSLETKKNFETL